MILVDSSVWIDYFNGQPTPEAHKLDTLLGVEPIGIADLILTEVLRGFRLDTDYQTEKKLLLYLMCDTLFDESVEIKWLTA